jgi:hypothetical protein
MLDHPRPFLGSVAVELTSHAKTNFRGCQGHGMQALMCFVHEKKSVESATSCIVWISDVLGIKKTPTLW